MIRLLLIILLFLNSVPAYAEWVRVGGIAQRGLTAYVDLYTIRRKGDLVKIWELWDYKTIKTMAGNSFLSIKAQRQYDCAEERYQRLTFTEFSGNMGSGTAIFSDSTEQKWEPVAPDSIDQALWEVACNKK